MSGIAILLIDESAEMNVPVARAAQLAGPADALPKSKIETTATAVNSLCKRLANLTGFQLAIVGYRADTEGELNVGSRWGGSFEGEAFVSTDQLVDATIRVEQRVRRIPGPLGVEEQPMEFPVWYDPETGAKSPQIAAFQYARELVSQWSATADSSSAAPLVINISSGVSHDGNPQGAVKELTEMELPMGNPVVMQAHLATYTQSDALPTTLFPANRAFLTIGPVRDMFDRTSALPDAFVEALKEADVPLNAKARGMIYNGKMLDLTRMLSLLHTHAEQNQGPPAASISAEPPAEPGETDVPVIVETPGDSDNEPGAGETSQVKLGGEGDINEQPAAATTEQPLSAEEPADDGLESGSLFDELEPESAGGLRVSPEQPAAIAFVVDRSVQNPFGGDMNNACSRLVNRLEELVAHVAKLGAGAVDVAVVSYGVDGSGEVEVRDALEGQLAGRSFVRDDEVEAGAISTDTSFEERANQGQILKIRHDRIKVVEIEPTEQAPVGPAFQRVTELLSSWCADHAEATMPPIVLHLTRGSADAAEMQTVAGQLEGIQASAGGCLLYHLVETETEHPSLRYPDNDADLQDAQLQALWAVSSPLMGADELAEDRPHITSDSRGFVVNENFDQLLYAIREAIDD